MATKANLTVLRAKRDLFRESVQDSIQDLSDLVLEAHAMTEDGDWMELADHFSALIETAQHAIKLAEDAVAVQSRIESMVAELRARALRQLEQKFGA